MMGVAMKSVGHETGATVVGAAGSELRSLPKLALAAPADGQRRTRLNSSTRPSLASHASFRSARAATTAAVAVGHSPHATASVRRRTSSSRPTARSHSSSRSRCLGADDDAHQPHSAILCVYRRRHCGARGAHPRTSLALAGRPLRREGRSCARAVLTRACPRSGKWTAACSHVSGGWTGNGNGNGNEIGPGAGRAVRIAAVVRGRRLRLGRSAAVHSRRRRRCDRR